MSFRKNIEIYRDKEFVVGSNYNILITALEYDGIAPEDPNKVIYAAYRSGGGVFRILIPNDDVVTQIKLNTVISLFSSSKDGVPFVVFFLNFKSDIESILVNLWY